VGGAVLNMEIPSDFVKKRGGRLLTN